jgi:hypothetical protein
MSVQLIVFPQYFDGSTPLSSPSTEFIVDGINFNNVNTSVSSQSVAGALPQAFVDTYTIFGFSIFMVNTWFRFSGAASEITESSGALNISSNEGIVQRLSNLTIGATYDLTLNITANSTNLKVYQYKGNIVQSTHTITGTGLQTISFDAYSSTDIIVIYSVNSTAVIEEMSCNLSISTPSGIFTDLRNGQVICDLYEDEDIPLSLSVDDFKNVAEKVQSYSKAFNLPATKRNNKIFDNIFEVTRTDTGLNFNPYKKTKCILKQDGFLLFEGYLRMIDISDKEGEISYNVNLYSEVIAIADVLGERTFSDLDFSELNHDYNYTEIRNSWQGILGLTNPLPVGSFAGTAGTSITGVLRYPFVDWTHQYTFNASSGFPVLPNLESVFRPFISLKYLVDRIFEATDFTYESAFFDTADFGNLFMDFNWGSADVPTVGNTNTFSGRWAKQIGSTTNPSVYAGTTFTNLELFSNATNILPPSYNTTTHKITATNTNQQYNITSSYRIENTSTTAAETIECQWILNGITVINATTFSIPVSSYVDYNTTLSRILNTGDTLEAQFKRSNPFSSPTVRQFEMGITPTAVATFNINTAAITSNILLQTLRGELGQWDFLKGLMTMFNLVTLPDEDNPSNIKIEPYGDVFINNPDSVELDWTDKIDVSEMKLMPLTDLNKKTIFKFVEDEDDYAFMNYKNSVGGHLYGSKKYDASEFTILAGEDEIIAEPFAATVVKPLEDIFSDFITPAVYSYNPEDNTSEGFENSPRIMYKNGVNTLTSCTYYIPPQHGVGGSAFENQFLQFSHLTNIPTITGSRDFHFGQCQLIPPVGNSVPDNLFNLHWLPYYSELYNPDTRIMTIKVNLSPSDINTFKFNDTVFIKNRTFRVNKIDYKPNDLATVEFILIP